MAKKNQVFIDVVVDDKGTTKRVAVNAKKLGLELDKAGVASDKTTKNTEKLNKSNKDLDRNLRGTAKMTSNSTKEFSKMQQGMGGLVGAYATLAAQVFAVSAAFQFLQVASDFRNLISGQEALGAVTGVAYKTITENIIAATDAQIQYGEAARAAAIGTAAGVSASQLTDLANAAKNASFALGRDLTDSFNRLIRGVTKAEPELLDELGIILRLETATEKYARSIGKTREELNAFERTQAVANDVLAQAERKFGAIEELMDPNAAALNQFTKSFDDLIKSFQVGVIGGLTPILQFLTQNTTALVATLTLLSLPILKAILPSMRAWRDESKLAAEESKQMASTYRASLDKMTADLADSQAARQAIADKAAKQAAKDIKAQGSKVPAGGGLAFLMGEGGSQGAAARILKGARKQFDDFGRITTGALEGYNEQQLKNLENSYNKKAAVARSTTAKITGFWDRSTARILNGWNRLGIGWNKVMGGLQTAAAATAVAVNAIFAVTAIIGAISLVISGFTSLLSILGLTNKELERQEKLIEGMSGRYDTLIEEIVRARKAREELLAGTQITSNIGQTLQSIDIPKFLSDAATLRTLDENADGFEEFEERVQKVAVELGNIDPRFKSLGVSILNNKAVTFEAAQGYQQVANELIDLGQTVDGLPEKFNEFDKAVQGLTKSLVKNSPLQAVIKTGESLEKDLQTNFLEAQKKYEDQNAALIKQNNLRNEQRKRDKEAFGDDIKGLEEFNKLTFEAQRRRRVGLIGNIGSEQVRGLRSPQEIKNMEDAKEAARALRKEREDELKLQRRYNITVGKFEEKRVEAQEKLNALREKSTELLNAGVSAQGKLDNLAQRELANQEKLEKARQVARDAELAVIQAEKSSKTPEEIQQQKDLKDIADSRLRLAERQNTVEAARIAAKRIELELERDLLSTRQRIANLEAGIAGARIQQEADNQGLGSRGFRNASQRRQDQIKILEDEKTLAVERGRVAFNTYNAEVTRLQQLEEDRLTQGKRAPTQSESLAAFELAVSQADAGAAGTGLAQAENDIAQANLNLNQVKDIGKALADNNQKKIEQLEFDREAVALGREAKVFAQLYKEQRQEGLEPEEINVELLKQQAKSMNDLATATERRQAIFDSIEQGFEGAFTSIIDGTKSAKEAFADMAKNILKQLARIIAEMITAKILSSSLFSFFGFGGGGTTPPISAAMGGVVSMDKKKQYAGGGYTSPMRDYSRGGMARGPQQGYNAVLHGNEAVVPLPDNRHIPVELSGGMGQQNNVTVNVNMDSAGAPQTSSQSNGPNAERMGQLIAKAVQDELQNQKRSGGILSPYGAA